MIGAALHMALEEDKKGSLILITSSSFLAVSGGLILV